MHTRARILLSPLLCMLFAASAVAAETPQANDAGWAKECSSLLGSASPAPGPPGILPDRLEEMARGQSHAGQHYVACSLFVWAAAAQSSAGNSTQSDTDKSMAKLEQKLGAGEKLGFVDKMNHTAEVLEQAEKPGTAPTQSEIDAVKSVLPQPAHPQEAQAAPAPAAPAPAAPAPAAPAQPAPAARAGQSAPAANPAAAPAPAASTPAANASASAPSSGNQGQSRAAGVSDWSQILGHYVCYYYGRTGGTYYVGGFPYAQLGLMPAAVGLDIMSRSSYKANGGPASTSSFSPMVPGQARPEMLGTITFQSGSLKGHKALLQTHDQFKHAIIFPASWKTTAGKPDAFSPSDTWCYQKH